MRPNFFLVGTTKGGTSTLTAWLRQHPDVSIPQRKELHFYCNCPSRLRAVRTTEEYFDLFGTGNVVGEASPCYLYDPAISQQLRTEFPDAKILVSLRDPAERFWSHHLMNEVYQRRGRTAEQVLEANLKDGSSSAVEDLLGMGYYGKQVNEYMNTFPSDQVKVVFLEDMADEPETVADEVFRFLNLAPANVDVGKRDKVYVEPRGRLGHLLLRTPSIRKAGARILPHNVRQVVRTKVLGTSARKPPLPPALGVRLHELYRADSQLLEHLIGDLPWSWHH